MLSSAVLELEGLSVTEGRCERELLRVKIANIYARSFLTGKLRSFRNLMRCTCMGAPPCFLPLLQMRTMFMTSCLLSWTAISSLNETFSL